MFYGWYQRGIGGWAAVDGNLDDFLGNAIARDFAALFCGARIGVGQGREVYECVRDKSLVLNVETGSGSFQNVHEWKFWTDWERCADIRRWLAPCVEISPTGICLLQRRTVPVTARDLPKRLPRFLTDLKPSNFGWLDGRVVCHGYAITNAFAETGLRKAKWNVGDV